MADLIEGVVIVNQLAGVEATRLRTALWEAVVEAQPALGLRGAA